MQSPKWYLNRLRSMSVGEILWRIKSLINSYVEQVRIIFNLLPSFNKAFPYSKCIGSVGFNLPLSSNIEQYFSKNGLLYDAGVKTIAQAEDLMLHKFTYFNHIKQELGNPINWHYDYNSMVNSPVGLSAYIDYRNIRTSGDCKEVWEPNRHHQLVVLGRAYKITRDSKYAKEIYAQIEAWLDTNPYGTGMNWRSPLELGVRLINWVFALELISDSNVLDKSLERRILHSIYLHCWDISRKISQGSSANNHLVGEVAGLFVASSWLPEMKNANHLKEVAKKILVEEIERQTHEDGCTKEQALGYEFFVLQFYIVCGLVGGWTNNPFPESYWNTVNKMLIFVAEIAQGGKQFPMFGDRDDGYVLDLGNSPDDINMLLNLGALLSGGREFKTSKSGFTETAFWLFGDDGTKRYQAIPNVDTFTELVSKAYAESGYYLLQSGQSNNSDSVSILFDCAELGYGSIAAHGHADALSIMLRVGGIDVLVDPGTYDYFTYPEWRKYFRSTAAHNTLEIDGQNQSELLGSFLWGKRANATCLDWQVFDHGGKITAQHDGYSKLADPVIHKRILELDGINSRITITDEILAAESHDVRLHFHLSEFCKISETTSNSCTVLVAGMTVKIKFDKECQLIVKNGQESPICGWLSRKYHRKIPIDTLIVSKQTTGNSSIETNIEICN